MGVPAEADVIWGLVEPQRITEGITKGRIAEIFQEGAGDASDRILRLVDQEGVGAMARADQLRAVRNGMRPLSETMWASTEAATRGGMYQAGQLAANQALDRDLFMGMPSGAVLQYSDLVTWRATQAVDDLISRHTSGYTLAERIYANGKVTTDHVGRIVDRALAQQLSASELAAQVRGYYDPAVPGGASYAASRLARTEINNAHHGTSIALSQGSPWVEGVKWNLSGSHPKPDPCDDLAERDDYNLGPGVYLKGDAPDKPHPHCLCFLTHLMEDEDEFINKLVKGQYDEELTGRGVRC